MREPSSPSMATCPRRPSCSSWTVCAGRTPRAPVWRSVSVRGLPPRPPCSCKQNYGALFMLVRCLHCQEQTEVPGESDLGQVICSACGGTFSLVSDRTISYVPEKVRALGHFELLEQVGSGAFGSVWR